MQSTGGHPSEGAMWQEGVAGAVRQLFHRAQRFALGWTRPEEAPWPREEILGEQQHENIRLTHVVLQLAQVLEVVRVDEHLAGLRAGVSLP